MICFFLCCVIQYVSVKETIEKDNKKSEIGTWKGV